MIGANSRNLPAKAEPETPCLALRPREAAKALGICERTLWEMTQKGVVPHIRLSEKIILYSVDSLKAWLLQQAQKSIEINPEK